MFQFAFLGCASLKKAIFPSIQFAELDLIKVFGDCIQLEEVSIPSINNLSRYAFYNCRSLKEVDFPELVRINSCAFKNCINLRVVTSAKLEFVGRYAFENCRSLVSLNSVSSIGEGAFRNCESLQTLDLSSVVQIGKRAFDYCNFQSLEMHAFSIFNESIGVLPNLTYFYSNADIIIVNLFEGWNSLEELHLPNLTAADKTMFGSEGCQSLRSLELGPNIPTNFPMLSDQVILNIPESVRQRYDESDGKSDKLWNGMKLDYTSSDGYWN